MAPRGGFLAELRDLSEFFSGEIRDQPGNFSRAIPPLDHVPGAHGPGNGPIISAKNPLQNSPQLDFGQKVTPAFFHQLIRYFAFTTAPLSRVTVVSLLQSTDNLLSRLQPLVNITIPPGERLAVFGDIHGQYFDLLHSMRLVGVNIDDEQQPLLPPGLSLLFLGDYVDRGTMGTEVVLTLCALKLLYPDHVHLIRGNHECRQVFHLYGFEEECTRRYHRYILDGFAALFRHLPLAVRVNNSILALHAGPPIGLNGCPGLNLEGIARLDATTDNFADGSPIDEILWSDPNERADGYDSAMSYYSHFSSALGGLCDEALGKALGGCVLEARREIVDCVGEADLRDRMRFWSKRRADTQITLTELPDPESEQPRVERSWRGAGLFFNRPSVAEWMRDNGIRTIIRGHMAQQMGWQRHWPLHADRDGLEFLTVFTASNYSSSNSTGAAFILQIPIDRSSGDYQLDIKEWEPLRNLPQPQDSGQQ